MSNLITINNLKKQLDQHKPFPKELIRNLDQWYKIELTYTSNAIEGNTLSRQQTALVVEKGLTVEGKSIVEHLEAVNHAKAWEYLITLRGKKRKDIAEQIILNIHEMILKKIDDSNAGRYRQVPVRIAGSSVIMPNALKIPTLMKNLVNWLQSSKNHIVDIAIETHFKFVSIHPFTDGNGRTARLLMNLILIQAGFPPIMISKKDRFQYIYVIEKGQLENDLSEYFAFMHNAVEKSLKLSLETFIPSKKMRVSKPNELLKIGDLARKTNESTSTIRFWTNEALLNVANYSPGGYQLYHPNMINRVKKIRRLQTQKRLKIKEIKKKLL